jgi:hypothetical protein
MPLQRVEFGFTEKGGGAVAVRARDAENVRELDLVALG